MQKISGFRGVCGLHYSDKIISLLYATFLLETQNANDEDIIN